MEFDIVYTFETFLIIIEYLPVTIFLSFTALFFSLFIALLMSLFKTYQVPYFKTIANLYVSFFRGTPLVVQLFLIYYGLPQIIPIFGNLDAYTAGVIGLSLNSSSYMTESIRASIMSVDKGQMEAGLSVGMRNITIIQKIILPQAALIAVPPLTNDFIDLIKGSSLVFILGVKEIMSAAQLESSSSFKFFECYLAVLFVYWFIIEVVSYFQKLLEKKFGRFLISR